MPDQSSRVRITGAGIVCSIGGDVPSFAQALREGRCGIAAMATPYPGVSVGIAAEIPDFRFLDRLAARTGIPDPIRARARKLGLRAPFGIQVSILAALEAWENAGLFQALPNLERVSLVVGGQNSSHQLAFDMLPKFLDHPGYLSPRFVLDSLETNPLGVLSELFGIHGEGIVVGGASATGNMGIIQGMRSVRSGLTDICLVVGIPAVLSPMDIQGFANMGAMGAKTLGDYPSQACRPFDARHEGFIYGQAGGCLILESPASAETRGALADADLSGGAIRLDGNASSDPNLEGEERVMRAALAEAGLRPSDIDYVNAHGSSSPLGDRTEADALARVFGQRAREVWCNSTKSLTGHCLYSAGIVEAIATVVQMREGFVHCNRNLETPICPDLRFCPKEATPAIVHHALSNSFGFGGINTSIVLESARRTPDSGPNIQPTQGETP